MVDFAQIIHDWQVFYATIAGASATLLGLLFVAVSINKEHLENEMHAHFRSLARQTFGTFMYIITFSLVFLIPRESPLGLGIPLTCIAVFGLINMIREMAPHKRTVEGLVALNRYGWSLAGFSVMISSSIHILLAADKASLYHLVSAMFMLLVSAAKSSWILMVEIKGQDIR